MATKESLDRALQKVAKWRLLFVGWQLGTRPDTDPESQAVRDHRDLSLMLRIEMNALTGLLLKKGIFTEQEWRDALEAEAEQYDKDLEKRFPGVRSTENGLTFYDLNQVMTWQKGWKP